VQGDRGVLQAEGEGTEDVHFRTIGGHL
jgi:hypothetical protein